MGSEVLIIGGGVIGLSIARDLHKSGVSDITILDRGRCGEEASWAAAGMLSPQVEADVPDAFFEFCCRSRDMYPQFADKLLQETGVDIEFDRTGTLAVCFDNIDAGQMLARCSWQRSAGLTVETINDEEISKAEPMLPAGVTVGAYFPNDWQVENRKLVAALRTYASSNGIRICEGTAVGSLIVDSGRVRGARTSSGEMLADTTILATGAWTSLIKLEHAGFPIDIRPVRGQIVCVEAPRGTLQHVIYTSRGYAVPRRDGSILVGSTTENVGFDKSTTDDGIAMLWQFIDRLLPATVLRVTDSWAGLRPRSTDGLPIIGSVPGAERLIVATGHYRNGILLAPVTGKLVADMFIHGSAEVAEFSPRRFAASQSVGTA